MPVSHQIDVDEIPSSFRPFAKAVLRQDDPVTGLIRLLGTVGDKAPPEEARDFALLLRRTLPKSARLDRITDAYIRNDYPLWYVRAINDRHRNTAYRLALEALVTPTSLVLEAGTGSGLFAMMAARAGAHHVYTLENDPHAARAARANIARNGLAKRITLIECSYEEARIGEHLPRRADLLLHEFVGGQFLAARVAPMASLLRDSLLTREAYILPDRFAAVGMLVGDPWLLDLIRVPEWVEDLNVSGINLFAAATAVVRGPVNIGQQFSEPTTLAEFNLLIDADILRGPRQINVPATASGVAIGVLQWVRHEFPDGSIYENRPNLRCNWSPVFHPFPHNLPVSAGSCVTLAVENTDTEIFIDLAMPHSDT